MTKQEATEFQGATLLKTRSSTTKKEITLDDFNFIMVLGRGSFGKVFLTELRENKKLYAIKSMRKDILIETE